MKIGQVENFYFGVLDSGGECNPNKARMFKDDFFQIYPTFAHCMVCFPQTGSHLMIPISSLSVLSELWWATRLPVDEEKSGVNHTT